MAEDRHYYQIRAGLRLRSRIDRIKKKYNLTGADTIRASIEFGSQILEKLLESRKDMVNTYIKLLKMDSRKGKS